MWDSFEPAGERLEEISRAAISVLPSMLVGLLVFLILMFFAKLAAVVLAAAVARRSSENLGLVVGRLVKWTLYFVGLLVALSIMLPTFKAGDLVQLLGIGGVAIGFAFRDILQNFLAGILILITRPFRIDDQIVFGAFEGTVEDIRVRATYLRTYDGRRVVIPNARLFTDSVTVNTAFVWRRTEAAFGIGYGDDVGRAKAAVLEAVGAIEGVAANPAPDVLVVELAASAVTLRVRWWTHSRRADVLDVQDRVICAVKSALTRKGIDIPFPTQVVLFHDQTEETDGDRRTQREGWPAGDGEPPRPRPLSAAVNRLSDRLRTEKR